MTATPAPSRIGLGTVQWGMDYGIANVTGRPQSEEVTGLLRRALAAGITVLDTARNYGESEAVIGAALEALDAADRFLIVSKVLYRDGDAPAAVEASVRESLKQLRLAALPLCLVHHAAQAWMPGVWDTLLRLRDAGVIGRLGVSISEAPAATLRQLLDLEGVGAVQVPLNVFDTQALEDGLLAALRERGVTVFSRSVFLKGLVTLPEEKVPPAFAEVLPAKRRLLELAEASGRDVLEFALQFPLCLEDVDCLLVGCETLAQLEQNLAWAAAPPLSPRELTAVRELARDLPDWIRQPWMWPGAW